MYEGDVHRVTDPINHALPPDAGEENETPPPTPTSAVADESTVGTGTFFALGCVGVTIILILIGILIIYLTR
jgi:hypothetical protein